MDMKLEVVVLPITDVERAKEFYVSLGWRLDADVPMGGDGRLVQMTPPAAASTSATCSTKARWGTASYRDGSD